MKKYHRINLPAHVLLKWEDMTERNDHTTVLLEIALFFSYAEYQYKEFERLAGVLNWILTERNKIGCLTGEPIKASIKVYEELKALITEGYGPEVWAKIAC